MVKSKRASWIDASASSAPSSIHPSASVSSHQQPLSSSSQQQHDSMPSTPSTSFSFPDGLRTTKSRKSSVPDQPSSASSPTSSPKSVKPYPHRIDTLPQPADAPPLAATLMHKSGSISKLREQRSPGSISGHFLPDQANASPSSSSSMAEDRMRAPHRSSFTDGNMADTDEAASIASTDTQSISSLQWFNYKRSSAHHPGHPLHERASSVSSIVTDSSAMTDDYYSPASSPRLASPRIGSPLQIPTSTGSAGDRGKAHIHGLLILITHSHYPSYLARSSISSSHTTRHEVSSTASSPMISHTAAHQHPALSPVLPTQRTRRRSSMSMLRNLSNTELANILNGSSPNPVSDAPPLPSTSSSRYSEAGSEPSTSSTAGSTGNISAYQHSLRTLLRKQLSNKRKPTPAQPKQNQRRSLPALDSPRTPTQSSSGMVSEADRDVVEINLDSSSDHPTDSEERSMTAAEEDATFHMQPVYPAMLLNATQSGCNLTTHEAEIQHDGSTSAPEMSRWWRYEHADNYFGVQGNERRQGEGEKKKKRDVNHVIRKIDWVG